LPKRAEHGCDGVSLVVLAHVDVPHRGRDLRVAHQPLQLSCTPAAVHDVKAAIRQVDLAACRKLASAALELASPREVRDLVSVSKK